MKPETRTNLAALLEKARTARMSPADTAAQRESFAFGNAKISNPDITRAMVAPVAHPEQRQMSAALPRIRTRAASAKRP